MWRSFFSACLFYFFVVDYLKIKKDKEKKRHQPEETNQLFMHTSRQFETMQQVDKAGKQVTVSAHRSSHTQQEHGLHGGVTTDAYMLTDTENYCRNSARTTFSLSSTQ